VLNLARLVSYLIISIRPQQWLKNLAVFAAIFFGGRLLNSQDFSLIFLLFIVFCLLSSGVYLINDIVDRKADKVHFSKRNRPIASGKLPVQIAVFVSILLLLLAFFIAFQISDLIFAITISFVLLQLLYSFVLKRVILLDVMVISLAFMLRVFAGSFAISEALSSWLILTVMMVSLFLAIGKRRSEVTLLTHQQALKHRETLSHYPINLLDGMVFMMAGVSLLTYSLFTFNSGRIEYLATIKEFLPTTLSNPRLLMVTIPIVAYGIFRYLYLIFEKKEGESPEKVLLKDFPLFSTVAIWLLTSFVIIYVLSS